MIRIYCEKAQAVLKETEVLTAGMLNYPTVKLSYSEDLESFGKAAVVRAGNVSQSVTIVNNEFTVPYECLENSGVNLIIGIRFVGDSPVVPSVWCDCGMIYDGADSGGGTGTATQSLVDQMIAYAGEIDGIAQNLDKSVVRSVAAVNTNANQYGTAAVSISDSGAGDNRTLTFTFANLKGNGIESLTFTASGDNKGRVQVRLSDGTVTDYDGIKEALAAVESTLEDFEETYEQAIVDAIADYIEAHPEYVTTVEDGAINFYKFASDVTTPEGSAPAMDGVASYGDEHAFARADHVHPLQPLGAFGLGYATCNTAESTATKEASITGFDLRDGAMPTIKFTYAVPANAKLNINSTGAKSIYVSAAGMSTAISADIIKAGDYVTFLYNGSQYMVQSISRQVREISKYGNIVSFSVSEVTT